MTHTPRHRKGGSPISRLDVISASLLIAGAAYGGFALRGLIDWIAS